MHIALLSVLKWFNKFQPDFLVFAFEGGNNWRKEFTAVYKSRQVYKGNRVVDPGMKHFYELITSFKETMKAHTSICCLEIPRTEADDAIAGYTQKYASPTHRVSIVSGDRDFTQLLKLPNVFLIDPDKGKPRNQQGDKDYEPDIDYWLFRKCVRGDGGDFVPSAFPRVRETEIRAAYASEYNRVNFMNKVWKEKISEDVYVTHRVGDLFQENQTLLSLYDQPPEIKQLLMEGIEQQVSMLGSYSHFHFLRFLEEYKLQAIRKDSMKFVEMFSNNQRFLKGELNKTAAKVVAEAKREEPKNQGLLDF
jgi:5'-3' exonuclease